MALVVAVAQFGPFSYLFFGFSFSFCFVSPEIFSIFYHQEICFLFVLFVVGLAELLGNNI